MFRATLAAVQTSHKRNERITENKWSALFTPSREHAVRRLNARQTARQQDASCALHSTNGWFTTPYYAPFKRAPGQLVACNAELPCCSAVALVATSTQGHIKATVHICISDCGPPQIYLRTPPLHQASSGSAFCHSLSPQHQDPHLPPHRCAQLSLIFLVTLFAMSSR